MKNQEVAGKSSRALAIKRPTLPMEVKAPKKTALMKNSKAPDLDGNALDEMIRAKAYSLYEARQCESGHALDDWLQAEAQTRAQMALKSVT